MKIEKLLFQTAGVAFAAAFSLQAGTEVSRPDAEHVLSRRTHSGIPSITASPKNGRLWCTWYGGPTPAEDHNNYAVLATSADGGDTWKEVLVVDPDGAGPLRAFDPEVWVAPDGKLRWVWAVQSVRADHLVEDVGAFSNATNNVCEMCVLDAECEPSDPLPKTIRVGRGVMLGKPCVLASGEQLWPLANWGESPSSNFYASRDGFSFSYRGGATYPWGNLSYDEHQVVALSNGDVLTYARLGSWDCPVGIGEAVSHDAGKTWQTVFPIGRIPHPSSRLCLTRLANGHLILVKHGPLVQEKCSPRRVDLTAYVSDDDGKTWRGGLLLDAREWTSYPDGQQLADGRIVIAYDHERTKCLDILFAEFTEADVLAGKDVSGKVRLRRRISGKGK